LPAQRKPTEVLIINGAFAHDPSRRREIGPKSDKALGTAPDHLSDAERVVWKEVIKNAPTGVLTSTDRVIVEVVVRLLTKFRADWLNGAELGQLCSGLARLGWTPADRSRVAGSGNSAPKNDFGDL
jgi:hypothetical protein